MSNYSTGNTERDSFIIRSIREANACGDAITVESLSAFLPPDFGLELEEVEGFSNTVVVHDAEIVPEMPVPRAVQIRDETGAPLPQMVAQRRAQLATDHKVLVDRLPNGRPYVSPETLKKIEAPREPQNETPHQDTAQTAPQPDMPSGEYVITDRDASRVAPKIAEHQARLALDIANQKLSRARDGMAIAKGVLRERRSDLASAIAQWALLGNGLDNKSDAVSRSDRQQAEIRLHLASTAADRAARAGRRVDTAKAFVQGNMRSGPSRGAYDRKAAARNGYINRDPNRGAVPKIPSER
jgi:hypothetical protein